MALTRITIWDQSCWLIKLHHFDYSSFLNGQAKTLRSSTLQLIYVFSPLILTFKWILLMSLIYLNSSNCLGSILPIGQVDVLLASLINMYLPKYSISMNSIDRALTFRLSKLHHFDCSSYLLKGGAETFQSSTLRLFL